MTGPADDDLDTDDGKIGPKASLGIQSVEIGMTLLSALAREPGSQSLANMAAACDMSRTKAHRYLTSLERAGFVEREPGSGRYRLGGASVQVGLSALSQTDFSRIGSELLPAICRDLDNTVFVTVWAQHGATIVRWEDTGQPIAVNVKVGSTMPLIQSATGRVFGAYLEPEVLKPMLARELKARLGESLGIRTATDATTVFAEVREQGIGRAIGSFLPSICALSVPVFSHSGRLAGAITALGLTGVFDHARGGDTEQALKAWARKLSARLGAPPAFWAEPPLQGRQPAPLPSALEK